MSDFTSESHLPRRFALIGSMLLLGAVLTLGAGLVVNEFVGTRVQFVIKFPLDLKLAAVSSEALAVVCLGSALTVLTTKHIMGLRDRAAAVEHEVSVRTSALEQANAALEREIAARRLAEVDQARYAEENERLYRASYTLLHTARDLPTLTQLITDLMTREFRHTHCGLLLLDDTRKVLLAQANSGRLQLQQQPLTPLLMDGPGLIPAAARAGEPLYVADVTQDARYVRGIGATRTEFAIPLKGHGYSGLLGVLNLESELVDAFDERTRRVALSFAESAAAAIESFNLFESVSRRMEETDELNRKLAVQHDQLQAVVAASRDGIILVSSSLRLLVLNGAAHALLGLSGTAKEWIGRSLPEICWAHRHAERRMMRTFVSEVRRTRRSQGPPREGITEAPQRMVAWVNLPVASQSVARGRLFMLRDITAQREAELLREQLTATIVHDLRNPLSALGVSLAQFASEQIERLTPFEREPLDFAQQATERMQTLVNAILDLHQLERGQIKLSCTPLSVAELCADACGLMAPLAAERRVHFEMAVPADLPVLAGDGPLLGRVLQNLLSNALKAAPPESVVRLSAESVANRRIRLSVHDAGAGIPADMRGRLFQAFATSRAAGERGHGLGLAFCRLVVEAHQGKIAANSEAGQGTTFVVTLPVAV